MSGTKGNKDKKTSTKPAEKKMADHGLNEQAMTEMKQAFQEFDLDGDGTISPSELITAMRILGGNPTDKDVEVIMESFAQEKKDRLNFNEFVSLMVKHLQTPEYEEQEVREAFAAFDMNGDGVVTADEIRSVMKSIGQKMTEEEAQDMVARGDTNGDGMLDYNEFARLMTCKNPLNFC